MLERFLQKLVQVSESAVYLIKFYKTPTLFLCTSPFLYQISINVEASNWDLIAFLNFDTICVLNFMKPGALSEKFKTVRSLE